MAMWKSPFFTHFYKCLAKKGHVDPDALCAGNENHKPISFGRNRTKSTPKSTAKFKSEFGSFAAKIHTARVWP